ncbi:putative nucleotide pyrophosphatase precursor [Scheffersomyces xylosifermentans]|uniref:putative nucleotide pyrophosphatase precursor n=1 Tax=Scheffersomyces xylosifermentans TaxID=1304137 RepID=UPI00315CFE9E
MSVNYTSLPQPHAADVPITDMDDDDDIIFNEQTNPSRPAHTAESGNDDFLSSLDYDFDDSSNSSSTTMFSKFKGLFKSKIKGGNSYEMLNHNTSRNRDSFEITDGEEEGEGGEEERRDEGPFRVFDLRDYKIKALLKQLKVTTALGSLVIFCLITVILYLSGKGGRKAYVNNLNKIILNNSTHDFHPTTIVISLDGFHPHYINPANTPTLHTMLVKDYGAPFMIPSFPSSTFPNHWTLVTGLDPAEHGIVGNTFYDPILKKHFINTNPNEGGLDPDFWQGGEPVWTTAHRQGVNAAVHMWPGSEVPTVGPSVDFDRYNGSELLSTKVDKVMKWIDREDIAKRPELILTYVPTVDSFGHKFGISGSNLTDALNYVDNFIDLMQKELEKRNLQKIVNLIVVSDHGMAPTSNDRLIYLDDLVDLNKLEHIDGWPLFGLRPFEQYPVDEIYQEVLTNMAKLGEKETQHYDIFKVEDLPKEWEFGGKIDDHKFNYRLAPLWIIPKVGYSVTTHKQMKENGFDYKPKGVHGYNNTEVLMRAIFLGTGPYFDQRLSPSKKVKPFKNTEVYNIICDTLNLNPSPNNGSDFTVKSIISGANELPDDWLDPLEYPNLPFKVDHIVNNATYDLLWKKRPVSSNPTTISISTNNHPVESMALAESSFSGLETEQNPQPTDFESSPDDNKQAEEAKNGHEGDTEKPEDNDGHQGFLHDLVDDIEDTLDKVGDKVDELLDDFFGSDKDNKDNEN